MKVGKIASFKIGTPFNGRPLSQDAEIEQVLREWRAKALSIFLVVFVAMGLPGYLLPIWNSIRSGKSSLLIWVYIAVYLSLVGLAVLPRLNYRLRIGIFFFLGYANAAASFARLGLAGSGRLYLVILPLIATLLIGARAGYFTAFFSLLVYTTFAILAHQGTLLNWVTLQTNPLDLPYWIETGIALAMFLILMLVLQERFFGFLISALAARQEAAEALEDATQALQAREERFALVMQGTNDGIWDWDIPKGLVYRSPRWKEMLGYTEDEIGDRFEDWQQLVHPADLEQALSAIQTHVEGQDPTIQLEHRLRHKDGTYRWILVRGYTLRDGAARPYRIVGSHTDITRRKRAEEEIRRQNEYLAALHETSLGILSRLDLMDLLQVTVERAVNLIGSAYGWVYLAHPERSELEIKVGTGLFQRYIGTKVKRGEGLAGKIWESGEPMVIEDYQAWPGRSPVFASDPVGPGMGVPLKSGPDVIGVIGLTRAPGDRPFQPDEMDVMSRFAQLASIALINARLHTTLKEELAERRQAEEALRESEEKFRGIVEFANTGVAIVQDGRVRFVNPYFAGLLGYRVDEMSGTEFLLYCAPEERDRVAGFHTRRMTGEEAPARYETTVLHKNGERVFVDVSTGLIPYRGKPATFVFLVDITKRKQAEREAQERAGELALAYQTLEQRVEERTRDLAALNTISAVASRSLDLEEVMHAALDKTLEVMGMELGLAYRITNFNGEAPQEVFLDLLAHRGLTEVFLQVAAHLPLEGSMVKKAAVSRQPLIWKPAEYPDPAIRRAIIQEKAQQVISVPLLAKDRLVGALVLGSLQQRSVQAEELSLLAAIGQQVGIAVENARLYEQAQKTAILEERGRLARELHDSVTQSLYSVNLYAEAAARLLGVGEVETAAGHLRELRDTAQEALREMRLLIYELRPLALEKSGLVEALRLRLDAVEARSGIQAELAVVGKESVPYALKAELYHITQEALNNVLKHASARSIRLQVQFLQGKVCLEVEDDGIGFNPKLARQSGGLGLPGIAERVHKLGGRLQIESSPGRGTRLSIEVPCGVSESQILRLKADS